MILPSFLNARRARSAASLATIVIAAVPLAAPAHGQELFNKFLPEDIYGTDVQPDVTVQSRIRPEYDNGGVRVGNFVIRPRLTESAGYESNVLGQQKARGASLIETMGSVDAESDTSRGSVYGSVGFDDNRYPDFATQSYTVWNARVGGSYNLDRDTATIVVSHENQVQTQRDLDVPQLTSPLAVAVDRLRLGYRAVFNRLSLTPEVDVERYLYNSGFADGVLYDQSFRNRIVTTPGVTAAYEFATRRSIVLVLRDTTASYFRGTEASPKRDYNDSVALGGIDYDLNGIVRARVLAGYERRTFTTSSYKTIQAPVAELTLIYNLSGLTTLTGVLSRRIQDSADEATASTTTLSGQLRVDHELRRNVILSGTASVMHNDYDQGGGSQTLYEGIASATYLINRYASASATYDGLARTGGAATINLNGLTSGGNYVDHRVLLQLKLAL